MSMNKKNSKKTAKYDSIEKIIIAIDTLKNMC